MEKEEYNKKMMELLNTDTYEERDTDPTNTLEVKINRILKTLETKGEITTQTYQRIRASGSQPPRIYGLPKIHKANTPLRPIVSCINSPTYKLSRFIAKILSPLVGSTDSFVMNRGHFVEMMRDEKLGPDEMLVSFDISSLFTNVPIQEAVQVIKKKLKEDQSLPSRTSLTPERIAELLEICLITTYFRFQGRFYEQQEGAAMGSPVSAIVANIYMEHFEELALRTAPERPRVWKRYVDDTCCIIRREAVDGFLKHLNNIRDSIKFTMEEEKDNSLPFLDTRLMKRDDGTIDITVYREPTHTDRYLDFRSHHPSHVKRGLVRCLQHRIDSITSKEEDQKSETD